MRNHRFLDELPEPLLVLGAARFLRHESLREFGRYIANREMCHVPFLLCIH